MESIKNYLRLGAITLLFIGWLLKGNYKVAKKTFLAMSLAMLSLILNGARALNFAVLILFTICITYPIETIIKSTFRINAILVILMLILMACHVVNNTSYISSMGRLRYTLGFENPNVAALFYSSAIYLFIVSRKKINSLTIIFTVLMSFIVFFYTNSRTSLLALLIFVILEVTYLILKKRNMVNAEKIFGKCSILLVDILFALNLFSVFTINKFMVFDKLLSFRISTFSEMINKSGMKCFLLGGTLETVDNFYYMLLFQYGIFIYMFVAISVHITLKKMITNNNLQYVALVVGLFLVAMMESSLIRPEILVTLVIWKIILKDKSMN